MTEAGFPTAIPNWLLPLVSLDKWHLYSPSCSSTTWGSLFIFPVSLCLTSHLLANLFQLISKAYSKSFFLQVVLISCLHTWKIKVFFLLSRCGVFCTEQSQWSLNIRIRAEVTPCPESSNSFSALKIKSRFFTTFAMSHMMWHLVMSPNSTYITSSPACYVHQNATWFLRAYSKVVVTCQKQTFKRMHNCSAWSISYLMSIPLEISREQGWFVQPFTDPWDPLFYFNGY